MGVKVEDYVEAARADRQSALAHRAAPHPAEHPAAAVGAGDAVDRRRDHRRGGALVSRPGPAAAGAVLGQHAQRRAALPDRRRRGWRCGRDWRSSSWCCRSTWSATACATRSIQEDDEIGGLRTQRVLVRQPDDGTGIQQNRRTGRPHRCSLPSAASNGSSTVGAVRSVASGMITEPRMNPCTRQTASRASPGDGSTATGRPRLVRRQRHRPPRRGGAVRVSPSRRMPGHGVGMHRGGGTGVDQHPRGLKLGAGHDQRRAGLGLPDKRGVPQGRAEKSRKQL